MRISKPTKSAKPKNRGKMQGEDSVDHSRISSSSISSSDSEAGLITNDEDREGMLDLKISWIAWNIMDILCKLLHKLNI